MVHSLNWKDDNLPFIRTEIFCTEYVKSFSLSLDKNKTYVFRVKRVLGKLAKHISVSNRLRHFTSSSVMIRFYNTYMKRTRTFYKLRTLDIWVHSEMYTEWYIFCFGKLSPYFGFKNLRYPSIELFNRSQIIIVFDFYVLKFAVHTSRGSQVANIKTPYSH